MCIIRSLSRHIGPIGSLSEEKEGNEMKGLKKIQYRLATGLAAAAVMIGTLAANSICWFEYYQPKAPEKLMK